ncbi:MAG: hypothetical protein AAGH38_01705 [Pseudomonadota bacterium]
MSKLIKLSDNVKAPKTRSFKEIRADFGLTRAEAALALDVSRASIENWERKPCTRQDDAMITAKFQKFAVEYPKDKDGNPTVGRNLIFNRYPLRMAREILGRTVEQIAVDYGYSVSAWKKFEGNGRPINQDTLKKLEDDVRDAFLSTCTPSGQ